MAQTVDEAIKLLSDYSSKISKLYINTKKCAKIKITRGYLETRLETLENYWVAYTNNYESFLNTFDNSEFKIKNYDMETKYEDTEESYMELKSLIKDNLYDVSKTEQPVSIALNDCEISKSRTKLPPISLPKFSGNYNEWVSFRDLFTSLIHNDNYITKIEKHHYLKSSLTGEAEQLLKHFALTEANYDEAWKTLNNRYDNKRVIISHILNRLLNQKKITLVSAKNLKELLDTTKECLCSLNSLTINTESWDAIVVHLVVSKLDIDTRKLWEQSLGSSTEIPTFSELTSFLEGSFRAMEMINPQFKDAQREIHKYSNQKTQNSNNFKNFFTESNSTCTYCSQNHYICHCKDFVALKVTERKDFVKSKGICFNCLVKGHTINECRQSTRCKKCNRRHHTLLHDTYRIKGEYDLVKDESNVPVSTNCNVNMASGSVILATARISVKAKNNTNVVLRALIDPGSQASFITEKAVQMLNLERVMVNGKISGISNTSLVTTKSLITMKFHSTKKPYPLFITDAYILKRLTSLLPSHEFTKDAWPTTKNLDLADPEFHKPGSIDVLLGADVHAQIVLNGLQKHESLVAINSHLGWLISGRIAQTDLPKHNIVVAHTTHQIDQLLRNFWEIEEYKSSQNRPLTLLENKCEEHYKENYTRNNDGRYIVRLPFQNDRPDLGNSRPLAMKRLLYLEKRFNSKPDLKEEYVNFMRQYLNDGHMELVPENEKDYLKINQRYYLPHHAVIKQCSLTTRLRTVFDGSAKPENGNSLNDELLIGPPLQTDIRHLIIKWRKHKICLVADIQRMYRQILVDKRDCDFQRILWRESSLDTLREYRLLTVTYGTSCAPFLAIRTLTQLAEDEGEKFPKAAEILKHDLYMDDVMTGAATERDAVKLQQDLTSLLALGGFPLHKWSSNSPFVLDQIPSSNKDSESAVHIKVNDTIKTLGLTWNSKTDNFELKFNQNFECKCITKRYVLSLIARTFDPLGWLAPAVVTLKIFMQKLWLAGLDWDEDLPNDLKLEWCSLLKSINSMGILTLPRWLNISTETTSIELHGFCDASCVAYAAVVYLRVWDRDQVKVSLLNAKTRVAPVKQVSLPRLELCGAALLSQLILDCKTSLNISDDNVFAWTDSTIVLSWLRKTPNTWTTFVANRTSQILSVMNSNQWNHIPSADNPADPASRGLLVEDLKKCNLWWKGPQFLNEFRKVTFNSTLIPETNLEIKNKITCLVNVNLTKNDTYLHRFSSLLKLVRVTAFLYRFSENCKLKLRTKPELNNITTLPAYLTAFEMKRSLKTCIRLSQLQCFPNEIMLLKQGKPVPSNCKMYVLNPYLDNDNILRVGGRLINAPMPEYLKSPIILSNDCPFSKLVVVDAHIKSLHGGPQLTLNCIRQKYWIIRGKQLVKLIIHKCIKCFKQRAIPVAPFMGNLPEYRVKPNRPFRSSGVDFAGPFTIKLYPGRCQRTCKAYVCLFVCTVTKAIHLELVSDLTSAAFIAAFKRFTSRRGHCQDIWSDCGTNFVGASRELDLAFKNVKSSVVTEIAELLACDQTTWHFIPPGAPHFGGLWEAGVKSIKGHLKRTIGQTLLTFEEFNTFLIQVEGCVNSRPLTLISSALDEPPLTPGHFLIGEAPINVPEENLVDVNLSPLDRWQLVQRFVQSLWRRWHIEYLTSLQHRYKWSKHQHELEIGMIVLVKDDRLPPGKWLLGRIVEKHPGSDGITRVVTLLSKNSKFKRPVTKLCPLPLDVSK